MKHLYHSGFSLIELMFATAIIAVLAAIAIPAYTGYVKNARYAECLNEVAAIQLAEEEFFLERNTYFAGVLNGSTSTLLNNYYTNNSAAADRNCTYTVVAGTTGSIATSYTVTATGVTNLAGEGVIVTKNLP